MGNAVSDGECYQCGRQCDTLKRFSGRDFDALVCSGECMAAMQRFILFVKRRLQVKGIGAGAVADALVRAANGRL